VKREKRPKNRKKDSENGGKRGKDRLYINTSKRKEKKKGRKELGSDTEKKWKHYCGELVSWKKNWGPI